MKIIKPGTPPGDKVMGGVCGYCGCQIECFQKEANYRIYDGDYSYYVKCPTDGCESEIFLNAVRQRNAERAVVEFGGSEFPLRV